MTEKAQSDFQIPPEMQPHCDLYLSKLKDRRDKFDGFQSIALERAIDYFEQNPEALLKDAQYYLTHHPEYLGVSPEDTEDVKVKGKKVKAKASVVVQPPSDMPEKIGDVEKEIMDKIFKQFAPKPEDEVIKDIEKGKRIKGSRF